MYIYNIILCSICSGNTTMNFVCVVVQLHVTANDIRILSVAQQCFYGKFASVATLQIIYSIGLKNYIAANLHSFDTLHIHAAFK